MVLVLLEPTQESLQPCRSTTTISRVSVRLCAQYPPFDAPTNACSTTASLEQQASRPFQTDPGEQNRTDFPLASDQTWSCVGLGWSDLAELATAGLSSTGFNWIRSSGSGRGIGEDERAGILVWLPATDRGFGWYTSLSDQPRAIIPSTVTTGSCLARLNSYAIPSFFGLAGVLRSPMQSHGHPEKI